VTVLLQYGAVAWKVAAGLVALVGLLITRRVRSGKERTRAQAESARLSATVSVPALAHAEGPTTLQGTLHGGVASTLYVGGRPYVDRPIELWIDYRGERVDLVGPVRIVRGTYAEASRGLPKSTPRAIRHGLQRDLDRGTAVSRALRRAAGGRVHQLAQVGDGSVVMVRGVLGGRGSVDRLGVRSWLFEPIPAAREIEIGAVSAAGAAVPLRWYSALALASMLAAATTGALYGLGRYELDRARSRPPPPALDAIDPLVLAAALPGSRDEALALLAAQFPRIHEQILLEP
jgi:hypothetical protein